MYVSTTRVLRQFAQKMAAVEMPADPKTPEERAQLEAMMQGPSTPPHLDDKAHLTLHSAKQTLGNAVSGAQELGGRALAGARDLGGRALDAGKSMGGMVMENPGYAALGGLGGAASLYAIARMLQSEEDRKRRRPILAPALGAVGGAVALPALVAALSGGKTPETAGAAPAPAATPKA